MTTRKYRFNRFSIALLILECSVGGWPAVTPLSGFLNTHERMITPAAFTAEQYGRSAALREAQNWAGGSAFLNVLLFTPRAIANTASFHLELGSSVRRTARSAARGGPSFVRRSGQKVGLFASQIVSFRIPDLKAISPPRTSHSPPVTRHSHRTVDIHSNTHIVLDTCIHACSTSACSLFSISNSRPSPPNERASSIPNALPGCKKRRRN